VCMN